MLQVKKEVPWVQPVTQKGVSKIPEISFDYILETAKTVSEAEIADWNVDVRPGKGIVKVRAQNQWEVLIDTKTAEILQVEFRRSDIIESLHDGSWFHDLAKLWVFLPVNLVVLALWITGVYLFLVPYTAKRRHKKQRKKLREKSLV